MLGGRSGVRITVQAPAKLNLFLEILARRPDGFHDIETVMTTINVYDSIEFVSTSSAQLDVWCHWAQGYRARGEKNLARGEAIHWGDLPQGADNLVHGALDLLRRKVDEDLGATVRITKRIPASAGLGGASADAAAALVAGNLAWQLDQTPRQLAELAGQIGSDVAFFLHAPLAICRGRGEIVQPLPAKLRVPVVVVRPPTGLATRDVYQGVRVGQSFRQLDDEILSDGTWDANAVAQHCFNRLQEPASRISCWIAKLQREFNRLDVVAHQMSGSGSSYFGLCRSWRQAGRVQHQLKAAQIGHVFRAVSGGTVRTRYLRHSWN